MKPSDHQPDLRHIEQENADFSLWEYDLDEFQIRQQQLTELAQEILYILQKRDKRLRQVTEGDDAEALKS